MAWHSACAVALACFLIDIGVARGQFGPSPVVVATAVEREVTAAQTFVGTVMAARMSAVGSAVDGRVIELLVNEGDRVEEGQPLVKLLTKTLELELASAQADADLRREELAELENGSRPEEIAQAKARMDGAEAAVAYADARHKRNEFLSQRGQAVTEDELEKSLSNKIAAQQALLDAKAAYDLMVAGPRKEKIAQAKARLHAQQELVRQIEDRIGKHTIRAPFNGYVSAERTEVGQWVKQAEVVAEVVELDEVEVLVHLPQAYVSAVKVGLEANVLIDGVSETPFVGEVVRVVPQADIRARTFPIKIRLTNVIEDGIPQIKAGMLARVSKRIGRKELAVLVPKDALVLNGGVASLRTFLPDSPSAKSGKVGVVPVQTGVTHEDWIQVRGDLKAGQIVIAKGNERVQPGQPVKILEELPPPK